MPNGAKKDKKARRKNRQARSMGEILGSALKEELFGRSEGERGGRVMVYEESRCERKREFFKVYTS